MHKPAGIGITFECDAHGRFRVANLHAGGSADETGQIGMFVAEFGRNSYVDAAQVNAGLKADENSSSCPRKVGRKQGIARVKARESMRRVYSRTWSQRLTY